MPQAETSGALPRGFGSHSHPSAAKIWPFPALQQKPSSPTRCHQVRTRGVGGPRRRRALRSEQDAGPACQRSGRPLASAAAARSGSSSSLLPATHTTPTLGSREARHSRRLHPLRTRTVFSAPQATLAGTSYLRPTQPPSRPRVWRLAHCGDRLGAGPAPGAHPRTARAPLHPGCAFTDARRGRPTPGYAEPGLLGKQTGVRGDSRGGPWAGAGGELELGRALRRWACAWPPPAVKAAGSESARPGRGSPAHRLAPQRAFPVLLTVAFSALPSTFGGQQTCRSTALVARPREVAPRVWCHALLRHHFAPVQFWEPDSNQSLLERNEAAGMRCPDACGLAAVPGK